jgi:hypothetical protein
MCSECFSEKNSDYFHIQHWLTGFYNQVGVCLLRGTDWIFKQCMLIFVFKGFNTYTTLPFSDRYLLAVDCETVNSSLTDSILGRFILEKLTLTQINKKFPAFCGKRRFITVFTEAPSLVHILVQTNPACIFPSHYFKIRCNMIFASNPRSTKLYFTFRIKRVIIQPSTLIDGSSDTVGSEPFSGVTRLVYHIYVCIIK